MKKYPKRLFIVMLLGVVFFAGIPLTAHGATNLRFVFIGTSDVERDYCQKLVEDFNASQEDIIVTPEYVPQIDLMVKLIAMCNAGTPPDMVWVDVATASDLQGMGYITDIHDYVADWEELGSFYQQFLVQVMYDGKIYSIPTMAELVLLGGHYRIDKFSALTDSQVSEILTWDDWLKVLELCHNKDMDGDGRIDTYGLALDTHNVLPFVQSLARNNGNMKISDVLDNEKREQWLEIFTMLNDLSKFNIYGLESFDYKDLQRAFADGLIVFLPLVGSWGFGNIYPLNPEMFTKDNIGLMAGPVGPSNDDIARAGVQVYGPYVFRDIPEEHKRASAEFIKFQGNRENAARFPGFMHAPARDDVTVAQIMRFSPYAEQEYGWYLEKWLEIVATAVPREKIPHNNELQDCMATVYLDLKDDRITPEQAYEIFYKGAQNSWPNWPEL